MQPSLVNRLLALTALMVTTLAPAPASAVLERVGPNSPANFLPTWYQDTTGLTLDFCTPLDQQELVDGWCLILPADVPGGLAPEVFPNAFSGEHFYWASDAIGDWTYTVPNTTVTITSKVTFVQAIEAAFLGAIGPGLGGVFGRLRIRVLDLPLTGTYTFYTPWGIKQIDGLAGDRIFDTEDIGINCAPFVYDCALETSIGPFLVPSNQPGGAELPPVTGPSGALYLSDPARIGPVTGSPVVGNYTIDGQPVNPNVFAIVAPDGQLIFKTHDFSTMGRIHTAVIPSRVVSDRASYARAAGGPIRLDAYATGEPTVAPRLPAAALQPPTQPDLWLFSAPCAGTIDVNGDLQPPYSAPAGETPVQMARNGNLYWAATAPAAVPAGVCLEDANARTAGGVIQPTYTLGAVSDQVFVTAAVYDPSNGGSLSVRASSSDQALPPILSLGAFGTLAANVTLVDDLAYVAPVSAPPTHVRVNSQEGGAAELLVKVGPRAATGVTLTADRASPQAPGTAVIFTAQGAGATEYLYRFWLHDGTSWSVARDWNAGPIWVLPTNLPSGNYQVRVDVWAGLSPTAPDATSGAIAMVIAVPPATGVTLKADLPSPQIQGTAVTFTATAAGSSSYSYRFLLSGDGGTSYATAQDWSPTATWTLPGTQAVGTYRVLVEVRTTTTVARDVYTSMNYTLKAPPATGLSLAADKTSPQSVGTAVLFTATATGATDYSYRFQVSADGGATYTLAQDWSPAATWTMPTTQPIGAYRILAEVRTSTAVVRDAYATANFTVREPPATGVTLSTDKVSPQVVGTAVVFTATPTGSTAPYSLRFSLSTDGGSTYSVVQDWSPTASWTMPDTQAIGAYRVLVEVRTSALVARDAYVTRTFSIREPAATGITIATDPVTGPQPVGTPVTFTATASGSTSPYSYRFWVSTDGGASFTVKQDWSPANAWVMDGSTPAGTYRILAEVRTSTLVARDAYVTRNFTLLP